MRRPFGGISGKCVPLDVGETYSSRRARARSYRENAKSKEGEEAMKKINVKI
jgi:hypothetical protein